MALNWASLKGLSLPSTSIDPRRAASRGPRRGRDRRNGVRAGRRARLGAPPAGACAPGHLGQLSLDFGQSIVPRIDHLRNRTPLPRLETGEPSLLSPLPPLRQVGRIESLPPEQRPDLTGQLARGDLVENPLLALRAEATPWRLHFDFGWRAHCARGHHSTHRQNHPRPSRSSTLNFCGAPSQVRGHRGAEASRLRILGCAGRRWA